MNYCVEILEMITNTFFKNIPHFQCLIFLGLYGQASFDGLDPIEDPMKIKEAYGFIGSKYSYLNTFTSITFM